MTKGFHSVLATLGNTLTVRLDQNEVFVIDKFLGGGVSEAYVFVHGGHANDVGDRAQRHT